MVDMVYHAPSSTNQTRTQRREEMNKQQYKTKIVNHIHLLFKFLDDHLMHNMGFAEHTMVIKEDADSNKTLEKYYPKLRAIK